MPTTNSYKIRTKKDNLFLRVAQGHFATSHSHINYYIDVTTQKTRLSEAQAVAKELVSYYNNTTIVDTILCLDGTQVIGTCLAEELTRSNFMNLNAHQTIYVVTPEHTTGSQLIFRDNIVPMIAGKNVLILAASVTTGYTAQAAIEAIKYYSGHVAGVCSIFATVEKCSDIPVYSVFDPNDLPGYATHPSHECPLCKKGVKIDALVNSFGFSKL
jgi:orotate phosphoribosyltransferase